MRRQTIHDACQERQGVGHLENLQKENFGFPEYDDSDPSNAGPGHRLLLGDLSLDRKRKKRNESKRSETKAKEEKRKQKELNESKGRETMIKGVEQKQPCFCSTPLTLVSLPLLSFNSFCFRFIHCSRSGRWGFSRRRRLKRFSQCRLSALVRGRIPI